MVPLMIAQAAFAIAGESAKAHQQADLSKMEMQAASNNDARAQAEFTRQQDETNRVSGEQKSDRQREFAKDLGMIRVASAEGFGMGNRFAQQSGYLLGVDLSRLESNREGQIESIQSRKVASNMEASGIIKTAKNKSESANTSFIFNSIGSAVQIAGQGVTNSKMDTILKNQRSGAQT